MHMPSTMVATVAFPWCALSMDREHFLWKSHHLVLLDEDDLHTTFPVGS